MLVYIDTEFTNFTDMDLISIGLVSADKSKEFYMENSEYRLCVCSNFVKEVVLPLLSTNLNTIQPKLKIEEMLREWFDSFDSQVEIVIDYIGDWELLLDLMNNELPKNVSPRPLHVLQVSGFDSNSFSMYVEEYFNKHKNEHRHHALCDARSNLYAYHQLMKSLY